MNFIRSILSLIIGIIDKLFQPKLAKLPAEKAAFVQKLSNQLALYQFQNCPFCVKVRWALNRMGLKLELRDAKNNPAHRKTLQQEGGKIKVPCLQIRSENNATQWLYESNQIIKYLQNQLNSI